MRKKILFISIFSLFFSKNIFADKNDQIISQGKNVYVTNCLMCHGNNVMGDGPVGSNLTKKILPLKRVSERQIIDVLNGGKKDLMPDYRTSLSTEEKQAVAKYIMEVLSQKK